MKINKLLYPLFLCVIGALSFLNAQEASNPPQKDAPIAERFFQEYPLCHLYNICNFKGRASDLMRLVDSGSIHPVASFYDYRFPAKSYYTDNIIKFFVDGGETPNIIKFFDDGGETPPSYTGDGFAESFTDAKVQANIGVWKGFLPIIKDGKYFFQVSWEESELPEKKTSSCSIQMTVDSICRNGYSFTSLSRWVWDVELKRGMIPIKIVILSSRIQEIPRPNIRFKMEGENVFKKIYSCHLFHEVEVIKSHLSTARDDEQGFSQK